jgi:nucleotide-binding universal stress UspA family protein
MFTRIMVPVDLQHVPQLRKALKVAADMAKHHDLPVTYVAVTAAAPGPVAHSPEEFERKLEAFGQEQATANGIHADTRTVVSHDPTTDVDDALLKAVGETGADVVVMASHVPGLADYVWPSNGGKIAAHADASVFVVRN